MNKSQQHIISHRTLLREEFEAEKKQFSEDSGSLPIPVRVRRGICRFPVVITGSRYNSLNQYVMITKDISGEEIEHGFEPGVPVMFFTADENGKCRYFKVPGTVSYVEGDITAIALPDETSATKLDNGEKIGIQIAFDETTYKLMFNALDEAVNAKDNRLAELREILVGDLPAGERQTGGTGMQWLNPSQQEAVDRILKAKDVMIVHGPPGTGKTTTLVEAIDETLTRERQVLVCAQSNMAVDWISEKLRERGIKVLRIGNPTRISQELISSTFEKRFEEHPDYPLLWKIRKDIRMLRSSGKGESRYERDRRHESLNRLAARETELEHSISAAVLDEAPVIASTLAGSASSILNGRRFSTLFVDEASQALEAATWIAITKADRVIFAGDHRQLPPTIKSYEAQKKGLGITLMESVAAARPECVKMLSTQYRCDPKIMNFSSEVFYDGKLEAAESVYRRNTSWVGNPVEWIDTAGMGFRERYSPDTMGRLNKAEARLTVATLKDIIAGLTEETANGKHVSFGIISPYRAQVLLLKRLVGSDRQLRPLKDSITVNTIDGFQGQERDIVIISMVRSNEDGSIGFLNELRRMNVAMTRARYKLIIIGDSSTLCNNLFFKVLYRYIKEVCQ